MVDRSIKFIPKAPTQVFWFKMPDGRTQSFRFNQDQASIKVGELVESGATIISDPFRKGAPLGGFSYECNDNLQQDD